MLVCQRRNSGTRHPASQHVLPRGGRCQEGTGAFEKPKRVGRGIFSSALRVLPASEQRNPALGFHYVDTGSQVPAEGCGEWRHPPSGWGGATRPGDSARGMSGFSPLHSREKPGLGRGCFGALLSVVKPGRRPGCPARRAGPGPALWVWAGPLARQLLCRGHFLWLRERCGHGLRGL